MPLNFISIKKTVPCLRSFSGAKICCTIEESGKRWIKLVVNKIKFPRICSPHILAKIVKSSNLTATQPWEGNQKHFRVGKHNNSAGFPFTHCQKIVYFVKSVANFGSGRYWELDPGSKSILSCPAWRKRSGYKSLMLMFAKLILYQCTLH